MPGTVREEWVMAQCFLPGCSKSRKQNGGSESVLKDERDQY